MQSKESVQLIQFIKGSKGVSNIVLNVTVQISDRGVYQDWSNSAGTDQSEKRGRTTRIRLVNRCKKQHIRMLGVNVGGVKTDKSQKNAGINIKCDWSVKIMETPRWTLAKSGHPQSDAYLIKIMKNKNTN